MAPAPPRRFAFSVAAHPSSMQGRLLHAACDGDLRLFKRLVRALDKGRGRLREAVEAARTDGGNGALQHAAGSEQLEVCSYLVEGLRVDVNVVDDEGRTPLVYAVLSENAAIVKYLLDHGADPNKADNDGLAPLHSAAGIGDCEMVELLLAKGAYVDPLADECGTPLHIAVKERQAGTMKVLLDHKADAINVSSVKCVKLLVEDHVKKRKIALKSLGNKAVEKEDYFSASSFYSKATDLDPDDATLFSNRSLCWLRMCDGQKALLDSLACREMRPDWPKACYRQGAAMMLLNDYKSACEAFFNGFMLDPENAEIENALRQVMEYLKVSGGTKVK